MNRIVALLLITVAGVTTGCASVAVGDDVLVQRTSFALGVNPDQFTISDRTDSGVRTDYRVHTKSGKNYACYVTGTISVTGRIVSDAVCSASGSGSKATSKESKSNDTSCNALLSAAGKCK